MVYQFDFSKITVGDVVVFMAVRENMLQNDGLLKSEQLIFKLMHIIDRVTIGGISHVRFSEMADLVKQFSDAYAEHSAPANHDETTVNRLLKQALPDQEV